MPTSPMKDLGPCSITWDPDDANIEINPTFGGVTFRDEVLKKEINEDQQGKIPVDHVHIGRFIRLTVPMTRSSLAKLETVIASSVRGVSNLTIANAVGKPILLHTKRIVIKPMIDNVSSSDVNKWLHIHKAYPFVTTNWAYDNKNQRVTDVVFKGFPVNGCCTDKEIWRVGPGVEIEDFEEYFRDDFDDGARNPAWTDEANNGTIVESGDVLTLAIADGVDGKWLKAGVENSPFAKIFPAVGEFTVMTKLNTYVVNDETNAGLLIGSTTTIPDDAGGYCFSFYRVRHDPANGLSVADVGKAPVAHVAVTTLPIWLRMVISGSGAGATIDFDYSTDGINWTNLHTENNLTWSLVGLHAKNWGVLNAISAPFEFFEMVGTGDIYRKYIESSIGNITAICEDGTEYTEVDSFSEVAGVNSTFYFDSSTRYLYIYTSDGTNPSNFRIEVQAD